MRAEREAHKAPSMDEINRELVLRVTEDSSDAN